MEFCLEFKDFEFADFKNIVLISSTLEYYFQGSEERRARILPELLKEKEEHMNIEFLQQNYDSEPQNLKKLMHRVILESTVTNDLYEYYLINVVLRMESIKFEENLIESIQSCVKNMEIIHADFNKFISKVLKRIGGEHCNTAIKDDLARNYEDKIQGFRAYIQELGQHNVRMRSKYKEHFEFLLRQNQAGTFRYDLLIIMYEVKLNQWDISMERQTSILNRFKSLDRHMDRSPEAHFYLNGYLPVGSNSSQEIEVLKCEYFLKQTSFWLNCVLSITPSKLKEGLISRIFGDNQLVKCQPARDEELDTDKYDLCLEQLEESLSRLKGLIDVNPPLFESFNNFGIDGDKLFTVQNFIQTLFDKSNSPEYTEVVKIHFETDSFIQQFKIKKSTVPEYNTKSYDNRKRTLGYIIEDSFDVVRKALMFLYGVYEKNKLKQKDLHFFLRCALVLKDYTVGFFRNQASTPICDKFVDFLNDEHFSKNIDLTLKYETDLKLNYLFNNLVFKNNLRMEFFDFISISLLENIKTFKKIEKVAFKENNPLYVILSLKSLEFNLRELFRKVFRSITRELDILTHPDFSKNLDSIHRFVNENEEANFILSDKKHYDLKSTKSLLAFVKLTPKTEFFDLVTNYIFEIYSAICHCYSFCRTKKLHLARRFYEESQKKPEALPVTLLMEAGDNEPSIDNILQLMDCLKKVQATAYSNSSDLFQDFKAEYLSELQHLLAHVLSDEYCSQDGKIKHNPFKIFDYVSKKK